MNCFLLLYLIIHFSYSYIIPNLCKYLHSITNGTELQNNCIASKFTTNNSQYGLKIYNYQGYFRVYMDSTNGNLMILTLNENEGKPKWYVNKTPINVPGSAFANYPYFNSTKKYLLPTFLNSILRISTNGIEIISYNSKNNNKIIYWKGNNGSCLIPELIMQYDRNLVLYCNIDKLGNPINPKWNSNTACQIKNASWCSNSG